MIAVTVATFANDLLTWHMARRISRSPVLKLQLMRWDVSVATISNGYVVCEYSCTHSSLLLDRVERNLCETIKSRGRTEAG